MDDFRGKRLAPSSSRIIPRNRWTITWRPQKSSWGVKSVEKAFEVQSEYVKTAYECFVAHATKIGELYADLAKELYKPIGGSATRDINSMRPRSMPRTPPKID